MTGSFRLAPEVRLRQALGQVYEDRWQVRGQYLVPASSGNAAAVLVPPGVEQDKFERIVSTNLADLNTLAPQMPADDANPARKRMRDTCGRWLPPA
jgi:hypothetical protein